MKKRRDWPQVWEMPHQDRQNRTCGFLDIEEHESSDRFYRRYFILDTHRNCLLWYMDTPQNLPVGTDNVGSLRLSYISKVSEAAVKQKPKATFCFVINALSRRYFLQANDAVDMKQWVTALNNATKITVPKASAGTNSSDVTTVSNTSQSAAGQAYKTEIVGGVVLHTPVQQSESDDVFTNEVSSHVTLRRCQSARPNVVRSGYCVKQGSVRKSWKRRYFILDEHNVSYYKSETDKEALRSIQLKDVLRVNECLVKSGDLLCRDNLFEIITSTRTFYIQTDTPEDMRGWISDIASKIQTFRGPSKGKHQLVKSCSVVDSWQPWTPVPNQEQSLEEEGPYCSLPSLSHTGHMFQSQTRQRHHSQPQFGPIHPDLPDSLDNLRTTDV